MGMKVLELEQGSDAWLLEHSSRVTASRVQDGVLAKARGGNGESTGRKNYRAQIVATILSGRPAKERFKSTAMEDGIELEPFARSAYEVSRSVLTDQIGFVIHDRLDRCGCSPDGLVGTDGMIQIKCPYAATHIGWMMAGVVPEEHQPQLLLELACTGRQWTDFVSYCPELPDHLQLFVVRFPRDDARIREMEAEVEVFLGEVDLMVSRLRKFAA